MATQVKQRPKPLFLSNSCTKCAHIRICAVFRAIAPLLESWQGETRPFEAEQLANICKSFVSGETLNLLNETVGSE